MFKIQWVKDKNEWFFSMSQVSEKTLREPRHVVEVTGSKMIMAAGGHNKVTPL